MDPIPGFPTLLARARAGDREATDELRALIRPLLEQLARNHAPPAGPDANLRDLVQEAWLRAWQKLDQFTGADDEGQALAMFRASKERVLTWRLPQPDPLIDQVERVEQPNAGAVAEPPVVAVLDAQGSKVITVTVS